MSAVSAPSAPKPVSLEFGGRTLWLLPEKAAYLPDARTLLVADVHIGKAVSFRRLGVPVPAGTTDETLSTLTGLVDRLGATRIVVLGDFLHSARALAPPTLRTLMQWRERHAAIELTLVRGNHDDHAGDPPATLGMRAVDEPFALDGLALCHHPEPRAGAPVLAGHLHPCIHLGTRANDRHRLPCFWFSQRLGVLPAFGAFTGMHAIRPAPQDRVFAVAPQQVFEFRSVRR